MRGICILCMALFFSILVSECSEYYLSIPTSSDHGITMHPIEAKMMKLWTLIDMLRAIHLSHQEKLSFLSTIVDESLQLFVTMHTQVLSIEIETKMIWSEIIHQIAQAFDELFDMLIADEIGCIRVILRNIKQYFNISEPHQMQ